MTVLVALLADLVRALRMLPGIVWAELAEACLTDGQGSVLDGMWLTDGDPWWGYNDDPSGNGKWVTGRGEPPRHIAYRP